MNRPIEEYQKRSLASGASPPSDANQKLKTCTKCLESKEANFFYSKGGRLESKCKVCSLAEKKNKYLKLKKKLKRKMESTLFQIKEIEFEGSPNTKLFAEKIKNALERIKI